MEGPKEEVSIHSLQEPGIESPTPDRQTLQCAVHPILAVQALCCTRIENETPKEVSLETTKEIGSISKETQDLKDLDSKLFECPVSRDVTMSADVPVQVPSESHSHSDRTYCRICQEDDTNEKLISPCYCTGSVGFMHFSCLEKWLQMNCRTNCELCSYPFPVERVMPTALKYFKNPAKNMDMSSLLCDITCFFLLTPLLVASTYLCSLGVKHYYLVGKSESVFAVATLMVSLVTVYCAWATLAILYHRRVWLTWREKNVEIHILADAKEPVGKRLDENDLDADSAVGDICRITSRQGSTSALLRPFMKVT